MATPSLSGLIFISLLCSLLLFLYPSVIFNLSFSMLSTHSSPSSPLLISSLCFPAILSVLPRIYLLLIFLCLFLFSTQSTVFFSYFNQYFPSPISLLNLNLVSLLTLSSFHLFFRCTGISLPYINYCILIRISSFLFLHSAFLSLCLPSPIFMLISIFLLLSSSYSLYFLLHTLLYQSLSSFFLIFPFSVFYILHPSVFFQSSMSLFSLSFSSCLFLVPLLPSILEYINLKYLPCRISLSLSTPISYSVFCDCSD